MARAVLTRVCEISWEILAIVVVTLVAGVFRSRRDSELDLDPLSPNYVGHNIALRHGVKCCCSRSVLDCPHHGR